MPPRQRRETKRSRLEAWLADRRPDRIDPPVFEELRSLLEPVSAGYLRRLLRDSGLPLAPLVEGVIQDSFRELERTLLALSQEYEDGRREARALVIEARQHMRWAEKRSPRPERTEMLLWTLTWLENPVAFPLWLRLRKRASATGPA